MCPHHRYYPLVTASHAHTARKARIHRLETAELGRIVHNCLIKLGDCKKSLNPMTALTTPAAVSSPTSDGPPEQLPASWQFIICDMIESDCLWLARFLPPCMPVRYSSCASCPVLLLWCMLLIAGCGICAFEDLRRECGGMTVTTYSQLPNRLWSSHLQLAKHTARPKKL